MKRPSVAVSAMLLAAGTAAGPGPPWPPVGARAHADGPPPAHTGGFGEPTCVECHSEFPLDPPGGSLVIRGLPDAYAAGTPYVLTVVLRSDEMKRAGFQMAARFLRARPGAQAGALAPLDPRVVVRQDSSTILYAQHTREGSGVADASVARWIVEWTAPSSTDDVVFHVSANSANGDDSPFGDLVYTGTHVLAGRRVPSLDTRPSDVHP